jgi:hypothetical protein
METGKFPTAALLGFNLWVWDLCIMDASDYQNGTPERCGWIAKLG